MADKHFYEQVREAIERAIAAFDDGKVTWVETGVIVNDVYRAANHFADAMRGDEEHFAILVSQVNEAIDDGFTLLDKPGTDADFDIPWVPESIEESGFAFLRTFAKGEVEKRLRARRAKLLEAS